MKAVSLSTALMLATGVSVVALTNPAAAQTGGGAAFIKDDPACTPASQFGGLEFDVAQLFRTLDADGDGVVTRKEYVLKCTPPEGEESRRAFLMEEAEKQFESLNADADDTLSLQEYQVALMDTAGASTTAQLSGAQTGATAGATTQTEAMVAYRGMSAEEIIGREVVDAQGETIGTVDDLVINPQDQVTYAILNVGGYLGIGEKHVAVRFDDLQLSDAQPDMLILAREMERERFSEMPDYDESKYDAFPSDQDVRVKIERSKEDRLQTQ